MRLEKQLELCDSSLSHHGAATTCCHCCPDPSDSRSCVYNVIQGLRERVTRGHSTNAHTSKRNTSREKAMPSDSSKELEIMRAVNNNDEALNEFLTTREVMIRLATSAKILTSRIKVLHPLSLRLLLGAGAQGHNGPHWA